jgi:hypothetical protein
MMLHATAAYLPEKLQPEEAAGFKDLASSAIRRRRPAHPDHL